MRTNAWIAATLLLIGTACSTASHGGNDVTVASATTQGGDKESGARIFTAYCANCHGAHGAGGGIGPSLRGETRRMDFETIASWTENPAPPMPKLYPSPLSDGQVRDVAAYVGTL